MKYICSRLGVPLSTQWRIEEYAYPTQIAQYGLSHYSRYAETRDRGTAPTGGLRIKPALLGDEEGVRDIRGDEDEEEGVDEADGVYVNGYNEVKENSNIIEGEGVLAVDESIAGRRAADNVYKRTDEVAVRSGKNAGKTGKKNKRSKRSIKNVTKKKKKKKNKSLVLPQGEQPQQSVVIQVGIKVDC